MKLEKNAIGAAVREMRRAAGLSAEGLCSQAKLPTKFPRPYISNVERGKVGISTENLLAIAEACGYEIELVKTP